ncbi:MAG: hypothetical protein M5Z89_02010 [Olivibacter sp.]|nr:hypothetical protein [Olivibacter sp. UJ_SKK_5.1]
MRDDIFAKDYRDRTKFFDLIIPIVPIISSSNSKDKFKFLLTKDAIEICELDELFIEEASQHIQDMRLLKNIVNEFLVHWRLLRSNYHYDGNELLAAIIYKNLEPKDFAAFHENKGYLRLLTNFKLYLYNYAESSYPSILKDERDNLLILKDITLKTLINALDGLLGAENPKQDAYLKHIQNILAFTDNERKAPLYDTYLKSPVFLTLLRSGYLNENVEQYISYMHLDSLGFEEQQYVTYLNQRLDPENLTIPINRTIVEKIYISVFEHRVVLIPSLVEYIFTNNGYDIHRKKVVNLLVQQKDKAFNFLDNLLKSDSLEEIISSLVNQWRNFWIYAPAEFLSKAQIQALCPSLPKIENQIEIIKSVEEDKLKTLIDGHKIEFNKENIEFISKSKPNSLAYFLSSNQDKLNEIKREDDWLEKLRRGHPNVSDENLKNLEISLWAEAKGYHDVKDRMKPNTIKNHSFFIHDVSDKAFREIDSNILKVDKGFISIWAFVNQHHLRSKPRYENRYILSHALNKGKKSENMPTDKYFYLAGWAIHLTNPKGPNGQFNCKFFCNKKTEPEHPDDHINKGIIRWGSISTGWHLFTVAWHKRKNYIKFFVNNEEITDKNEDFTYKNYWPDEYSGRINIGCWEDRNDQTHHFNSQIGPFIMVAEELTQETLDTYFAVKPK